MWWITKTLEPLNNMAVAGALCSLEFNFLVVRVNYAVGAFSCSGAPPDVATA